MGFGKLLLHDFFWMGIGSFGWTNKFLKVLVGWNEVLVPNGARIHLMCPVHIMAWLGKWCRGSESEAFCAATCVL